MTDTLIVEETKNTTDTGEPKMAHLVRKEDQMKGYILGEPVTALCGKTWVPSRDPKKYPLCERCKEIAEQYKQKHNN